MSFSKGSAITPCEPSADLLPHIEISSISLGLCSSPRQRGRRGVGPVDRISQHRRSSVSSLFLSLLHCLLLQSSYEVFTHLIASLHQPNRKQHQLTARNTSIVWWKRGSNANREKWIWWRHHTTWYVNVINERSKRNTPVPTLPCFISRSLLLRGLWGPLLHATGGDQGRETAYISSSHLTKGFHTLMRSWVNSVSLSRKTYLRRHDDVVFKLKGGKREGEWKKSRKERAYLRP